MPSSQFVTNLIALKKSAQSPETSKTKSSSTKLQTTLKKDLTDPGNLGRFFDGLPSNLLEEKKLAQFENYFLSLFKTKEYPKAKTGLLVDRIILQSCQDLLDSNGVLDKSFIDEMKLPPVATVKDEHIQNSTLISAYLVYFVGILSEKIGPTEQKVMDSGIIKDLKSPTPRAIIINQEFNQDRTEHITDLIEKTRFANALRKCSEDIFKNTHIPMLEYCKLVKAHVLNEMHLHSAVEYRQAQLYWVDIMYICKELGDYNTFFAIYRALANTNIALRPNETVSLKYNICEKLANPGDDYKNIYRDAIVRAKNLQNYVPFCLHIPEDSLFTHGLDAKSTEWKTSVNDLFAKDHFHHKQISQLTYTAGEKITQAQKSLQALLDTLVTESANLKPAKPEASQETSNLLTNTFRFFKSTFDHVLIDVALEGLQSLLERLLKSKASVTSIHDAATSSQYELKLISAPDNKNHPLTKALAVLTKTLIEIQQACTIIRNLGQETIPGLKASAANERKERVLARS